jgi:hypothetical protein
MFNASVRIIGKDIVDAKLLAAAPRIAAQNRFLVNSMLEFIKVEVVPQIPIGPGHFGYHARDTFTTDVKTNAAGITTTGVLKAAAQAYWREFGTLGRYKKGAYSKPTLGNARAALYAATVGTGGEPPRPIVHTAYLGARKFIDFYYNGLATWWGG